MFLNTFGYFHDPKQPRPQSNRVLVVVLGFAIGLSIFRLLGLMLDGTSVSENTKIISLIAITMIATAITSLMIYVFRSRNKP